MTTLYVLGTLFCEGDHDPGDGTPYSSSSSDFDDYTFTGLSLSHPRRRSTCDIAEEFLYGKEVQPGTDLWHVHVIYGDYDTFNSHSGLHETVEIFDNEEYALALKKLIEDFVDVKDRGYDYKSLFVELHGKRYGVSHLVGWGQSFTGVDVNKATVQP